MAEKNKTGYIAQFSCVKLPIKPDIVMIWEDGEQEKLSNFAMFAKENLKREGIVQDYFAAYCAKE